MDKTLKVDIEEGISGGGGGVRYIKIRDRQNDHAYVSLRCSSATAAEELRDSLINHVSMVGVSLYLHE